MPRKGQGHLRSVPEAEEAPENLGWPPVRRFYHRTSRDPGEPALVNGRRPRVDPKCAVCTLPQTLTGKSYSPEQAAWAEYEVVKMLVLDFSPEEVSRALKSGYGVPVTAAAVKRHKLEHVFSAESFELQRLRDLTPEAFNAHSWRSLFDTLHLVVEKTRQGIASGEIQADLKQGLAAAKILGELLSYSLQAQQENANEANLGQMQMFVGVLSQVIEDEVEDEHLRDDLFEKMQQALAEHSGEGAGGPEYLELPRGREE